MKKIMYLLLVLPMVASAQLDGLLNKAKEKVAKGTTAGSSDIASGLKEALNKGIDKQVSKLTSADGFYKNDLVKIAFPEELKRVDKALRAAGLSSLADEGVKSLNRAAEEAVKEATPIFVSAVKNMSFADAKNILLGNNTAATAYLEKTTTKELYAKFSPVVKASIGKVGADTVWKQIITKYNSLPLVSKINPDINDYVTNKALAGVFTMIGVEEKEIRTNLNARTSDLLKEVFAMQDGR